MERILESDRPGLQSQFPYGVALLLGQITEPFAPLSLQRSQGQHKSSSGGANEIRDGALVTSCHTSARKVPVTSQVTQSKGSCQDCQNLASPGLPSCFLSPSHSAPTVLVSLLPFNTRHISTPGSLHCRSPCLGCSSPVHTYCCLPPSLPHCSAVTFSVRSSITTLLKLYPQHPSWLFSTYCLSANMVLVHKYSIFACLITPLKYKLQEGQHVDFFCLVFTAVSQLLGVFFCLKIFYLFI